MPILIDENTRLLVQGITGRQAFANTLYMRAYGTRIVAGVTPGKGGRSVDGVPVYGAVTEAVAAHPEINATVVYVPPRAVKGAAIEALTSGIPLVFLTTERVPQQDMLEVIEVAREKGARVVGPNTIGAISPGRCVVGLIGARVDHANLSFRAGPVGVLSRSGGQTTTVSYYLTRAGIGQSTALCVGGDPFVGTTWPDVLDLFERDPSTRVVAAFGEIGTDNEELAAEEIRAGRFTKRLVVYISGREALPGVRFGHAGALIRSSAGSAEAKRETLRSAGAVVLEHLDEMADAVGKAL
ncbi:MAG: CoA-binding protein [Planctomycetes bacterium]|nr:CoA-binding protein [Planctomycetota bacterium]